MRSRLYHKTTLVFKWFIWQKIYTCDAWGRRHTESMSWLFDGLRDSDTPEGGVAVAFSSATAFRATSELRNLMPIIGVLDKSNEKSSVRPNECLILWNNIIFPWVGCKISKIVTTKVLSKDWIGFLIIQWDASVKQIHINSKYPSESVYKAIIRVVKIVLVKSTPLFHNNIIIVCTTWTQCYMSRVRTTWTECYIS